MSCGSFRTGTSSTSFALDVCVAESSSSMFCSPRLGPVSVAEGAMLCLNAVAAQLQLHVGMDDVRWVGATGGLKSVLFRYCRNG
jgi:hypothetical protein